jgi:hypothetical protein
MKRNLLIPVKDLKEGGEHVGSKYSPIHEIGKGFSDMPNKIKQSNENFEFLNEIDNFMKEQQEVDEINPIFRYFYEPVADGKAYYQVVNLDTANDKFLVQRCEGICLDEYSHGVFGDIAWVDAEYVYARITQRDALSVLFSKK